MIMIVKAMRIVIIMFPAGTVHTLISVKQNIIQSMHNTTIGHLLSGLLLSPLLALLTLITSSPLEGQ